MQIQLYRRSILKFSTICCLLLFNYTLASQIVLKNVGTVGDQYLTSRDVQISQALESIIYFDKKVEIDITSAGFNKEVTSTLIEWVVFLESENFSIGEVGKEELNDQLKRIEKNISDWTYWQELKVSQVELRAFVHRKLKAKKFLQFKTESSGANITDAEAKEYYDKNRIKFGNVPFSSLKENIKSFISKQVLENRLREWFEVLKSKYHVRNYELDRIKN